MSVIRLSLKTDCINNTRNNLGTNDWCVVYDEVFNNRSDAMKREKEIKDKKSRKYIEWLIQQKG